VSDKYTLKGKQKYPAYQMLNLFGGHLFAPEANFMKKMNINSLESVIQEESQVLSTQETMNDTLALENEELLQLIEWLRETAIALAKPERGDQFQTIH
jgi:hypothetical protein